MTIEKVRGLCPKVIPVSERLKIEQEKSCLSLALGFIFVNTWVLPSTFLCEILFFKKLLANNNMYLIWEWKYLKSTAPLWNWSSTVLCNVNESWEACERKWGNQDHVKSLSAILVCFHWLNEERRRVCKMSCVVTHRENTNYFGSV